jgi:hypothetical protein
LNYGFWTHSAVGKKRDVEFWILDVGLAAESLWRVTSNWCRDDADEDVGVPKWDGIKHSALFIQNFAGRAECAFPRDHFLTRFTELTGLVGLE